jgi:3-oxoacyl-[acyl-carrier protein] reductase
VAVEQNVRPVVLVTGVGRTVGIGAGIVERLAATGWDVGYTYWRAYDDRMPWGREDGAGAEIGRTVAGHGGRSCAVEADLSDPATPATVFDQVTAELGPVRALVMAHAESVDSDLLTTTVESFDRHFAVNARAAWLLIREFGLRLAAAGGSDGRGGRIIALTSDHTVGNVPYGASKGALDRITIAAAREFAHLGVSSNVINPGPVETGWMGGELAAELARRTPLGRLGTPRDTGDLVAFLCSPEGGWISGQLLYSNGGFGPN